MSYGVPLDFPIRERSGHTVSGAKLYILKRGDPDRAPDLSGYETDAERLVAAAAWVAANETEIQVYADPELTEELPQPLTTGTESLTRAWVAGDAVDRYAPQDALNPIQPWEAAPGRPWRDGGFALSPYDGVLPQEDDIVVGVYPPADIGIGTRGQKITGSSWYTSDLGRWFFKGAVTANETGDPAEFIGRSQAGRFPWGPMGPVTLLGADVAPGATEFWALREQRNIPLASYNGPGLPFKVGDQTVVYGLEYPPDEHDQALTTVKLCGAHSAGATELLVVRSAEDWPSSGYTLLGEVEYVRWTGMEEAFAGTLTADVRPGDTTISVSSTAGLPAPGMIEATTSGGERRAIEYTTIDSPTQFGGVTGVTRLYLSGSDIRVMRLTGLSKVVFVDTMLTAPAVVGATEIKLFDPTKLGTPTRETQNPEHLPESGSALLNTFWNALQQTVSWTSKSADGSKLLGVTGINSGITLNGVEGTPQGIPHGSALTYVAVGTAGIAASKQNTGRADLVKFTPASGFVSGVSAGALCQFVPRERAPSRDGTTLMLVHANAHSPGGYQSRNAQVTFSQWGDARDTGHYGGTLDFLLGTKGPNTLRRNVVTLTDKGSGIPGPEARRELLYPWHVHGPFFRTHSQIMSATVTGSGSTRGWPSSGRFKIGTYNRVTNTEQDREFDYTGLGPNNDSFTGVTYDGTDGYSIGDFVSMGAAAILAPRVQFKTIVGRKQVMANELETGETTIGNIGPTTASPEPGIKMGRTSPLSIYRRADGKPGTGASDILATETYADLLAQGIKWKATARAATTASITLSNVQTIDGVSVVAGDRVLVKNQGTQSQNGIYLCVAGGAWTRTTDADSGTELEAATVAVAEGTVNGNTTWRQTTQPVTLGSSSVVWTEMAGLTTAGAGLTRTGNTVDVVATAPLVAGADNIEMTAAPSPPVNRQVFTSSGTWTKPTAPSGFAAYTEVEVEMIGGGGGGSSGRRAGAGTDRGGGGGGAGGNYSRQVLPLAACGATEAVTVGVGGASGAAITTDGTSGNPGLSGGRSQFGSLVVADGGGGSAAPGATVPPPNAGVVATSRALIVGQAGTAGGGPTASIPTNVPGHARGGAGAGSITSANVVGDGAIGGRLGVNGVAGGSAGASGAAGGNGPDATISAIGGGGGGGGGGASITAAAGAGGNGGLYGSGGGGGGASLNGNNSGAGGAGAAGIVVVTTR